MASWVTMKEMTNTKYKIHFYLAIINLLIPENHSQVITN